MPRRVSPILTLWLVLLLAALACNAPTGDPSPAGSPENQATLAALLFPSATPGANPGGEAGTGGQGGAPTQTPPPAGQPFAGLSIAVPGQAPTPREAPAGGMIDYLSQPGDTLAALAGRFAVEVRQINGAAGLPETALLAPGTLLTLPLPAGELLPGLALLPDSEVVYGPPAAGFDIQAYVDSAGGYLSGYSESVDGETLSGAQIVRRIALETSTNPRLLLAALEFRAGWVTGSPRNAEPDYPIGFAAPSHRGLYKELALVTRQLTQAYYGWRAGSFTRVEFMGGGSLRPDPSLNAGSVALQNLFARLYPPENWLDALYGESGFLALYTRMFGDAWARAAPYEPLLPGDLAANQPDWQLPFPPGQPWSFTGGPHLAWGIGSPLGALDFAPADEAKGCYTSARWATASAPGIVARSERGLLVLDLDADGHEQTGWSMLYLHLADEERLPAGAQVEQDAPLGHPSCEGGPATGKHVHIVRKYNGEWIGVGHPLPFVLSGWLVEAGDLPYRGSLHRDGQVIEARTDGSAPARIVR